MTVPIIGDQACREKYNPRHDIADSMICAGVEEGLILIILVLKTIILYNNISYILITHPFLPASDYFCIYQVAKMHVKEIAADP